MSHRLFLGVFYRVLCSASHEDFLLGCRYGIHLYDLLVAGTNIEAIVEDPRSDPIVVV